MTDDWSDKVSIDTEPSGQNPPDPATPVIQPVPAYAPKRVSVKPYWVITEGIAVFALLAVIGLVVVQRTITGNSSSTVTKANQIQGLALVGVVASVDQIQKTISLTNLATENRETTYSGTWTAIGDKSLDLSFIKSGRKVLLDVDPSTFEVERHSFTFYSVSLKE